MENMSKRQPPDQRAEKSIYKSFPMQDGFKNLQVHNIFLIVHRSCYSEFGEATPTQSFFCGWFYRQM